MTMAFSFVSWKVQVTASPGAITMLANGLPSEQVALSSRQPAGTVSVRL